MLRSYVTLLRVCSGGLLLTAVTNVIGLSFLKHENIAPTQNLPLWIPEIKRYKHTSVASPNATVWHSQNKPRQNPSAILKDMVDRQLKNPKKHVSACLLIRDDNEILNEWIAYHYHTLKLRYLLVAVDPASVTSPNHILSRWQNMTDLKVLQWSDTNFMPESFLKNGHAVPLNEIKGNAKQRKWHKAFEDEERVTRDLQDIANHRFRQLTFLSACYRHMRDIKKTWVIHIDTDEYLTVNPVLRKQGMLGMAAVPKDLRDPLTLFRFLLEIRYRPRLNRLSNFPCISVPRLMFGSVENDTLGMVQETFQEKKFETVRWKYHTDYSDRERNALQKVIVDVSAPDETDEMFQPKAFSIHRPSKQLCRSVDQMNFTITEKYPLSVNHFLGSWERYASRNDTRRSRSAYEAKAFVEEERDDWMASWIGGFLDHMDPEVARELLQDYI